ncbi:MAG TPA: hypothetical protein VIA29_00120, partial [Thermoanaerobaculia bacterium]
AEIGPELADLGTHTDVAVHEGRTLSNKAPGLSVAALPGYRLMRLWLPMPRSLEDWLVFYGARVLSVTLAVVGALILFVRRALREASPSPLLPLWLFALLFATPFAVYARSFFSHAFAAALLFAAYTLAVHERRALSAAVAGLLAGIAVAAEYPLAVIAVTLAFAVAMRRSWTRLAVFLSGAAVPAAALAIYHAKYFGGVFRSPPAASASYAEVVDHGLVGIGWPSLSSLAGLFFDPAHGLLYFSPFLILWPIVAVAAIPRLRQQPALLVPAVGPLLLLLLISGYLPPHWRGGWALGPRYLFGGMLLVGWLLAVRVARPLSARAGAALLATVSYGAVVLAVMGSTFWTIPYGANNPARTVSLYLLERGIAEFNLGIAAGLPPIASLLPPLLAGMFALAAAVRATNMTGWPRRAGLAVGVATSLLLLAIPPSAKAIANSHREGLLGALGPAMHAGWR